MRLSSFSVLALGLMLAIVPLMWLGQSVLLRAAGMPPRWRISADGAPEFVRTGGRVVTQAALLGVIVGFPLIRGASPIAWYAALLPRDGSAWSAAHGFCLSAMYLAVLYVSWNAAGCVRFEIRHRASKLARRVAMTPVSALFGAFVEEALFRGVLLRDLLASLPVAAAVAIGSAAFAAAHYVRAVKRRWTFAGHVALGLCLCLAYVWSGSLWLPIGIHAGGIFAIMAARPFVVYEGPAWVSGASIFPFAGVVGVSALGLLSGVAWCYYGGP
ncbi:MAG: CPBP family intramembrane metalloprotease [Phycisphaerae bacterium]|nr:CPBP family intramembrane metalloprotease [Phycisphaerae bacterium]NUQ47562.1 CPBP family intramembrane metalloprotease [Phycisphaerae bacterium]